MRPELEQFYLTQREPNKSCFLALRDIILKFDKALVETRKYGMPCFCYGKKHFCYLWSDKKSGNPYILMVEGNKLCHPMLEQGTRSRMKVFNIDPTADLPVEQIEDVFREARKLYQ